jgi:hypothetical protein
MQPATPTLIPFLVAVPVIIWRLYSRVRRSVGRQTFSRIRPRFTLVLFPLLTLLLAFAVRSHLASLGLMAGGVIAGAALGIFGISKTKFENTPEGMFYTPNAHLGIALSALFAARVVYRMSEIYSMGTQAQTIDFTRSPLTLGIFGLLAGYYVAYAIGLVRWHQRIVRETAAPASTPP